MTPSRHISKAAIVLVALVCRAEARADDVKILTTCIVKGAPTPISTEIRKTDRPQGDDVLGTVIGQRA